jgi:hypothetical protein
MDSTDSLRYKYTTQAKHDAQVMFGHYRSHAASNAHVTCSVNITHIRKLDSQTTCESKYVGGNYDLHPA